MQREALRRVRPHRADALESGLGDRGGTARGVGALRVVLELSGRALEAAVALGVGALAGIGRSALRGAVGSGLLRRLLRLDEDALELLLVVLEQFVGTLLVHVAAADEGLGVQATHGLLRLDQLVHERLRHRRVVALVVTAAAVAHHVDDDVLVERLAVLEREFRDADAGLRVVTVDVEDRRLHHARDVRRVRR